MHPPTPDKIPATSALSSRSGTCSTSRPRGVRPAGMSSCLPVRLLAYAPTYPPRAYQGIAPGGHSQAWRASLPPPAALGRHASGPPRGFALQRGQAAPWPGSERRQVAAAIRSARVPKNCSRRVTGSGSPGCSSGLKGGQRRAVLIVGRTHTPWQSTPVTKPAGVSPS